MRKTIRGCLVCAVICMLSQVASGKEYVKPRWEERLVHLLINEVRSDPVGTLADCEVCLEKGCYKEALTPLYWDDRLAKVARFHAAHMVKMGCFSHRSSCRLPKDIGGLFPAECDGGQCACRTKIKCDSGEDSFERIALFDKDAVMLGGGENLGGSSGLMSPEEFMEILYWEPSKNASCVEDENEGNGHRINILNPKFKTVGVGMYCDLDVEGELKCAGVQVFGVVKDDFSSQVVSSKAHQFKDGKVIFKAHWYASGKKPKVARLVFDEDVSDLGLESFYDLSLMRGSQENGVWGVILDVKERMAAYHFEMY